MTLRNPSLLLKIDLSHLIFPIDYTYKIEILVMRYDFNEEENQIIVQSQVKIDTYSRKKKLQKIREKCLGLERNARN